jgi:hypothetical protein
MKHRSQGLLTSMLSLALLALPALASGATYYVNAGSGTDSGNCSTACKTITYAAANVPAGTSADPSIIEVAAGTYDTTSNGETFPIVFTTDYVSLTGAGSGSTTIDAESSGDALNVTGMDFSVSGFTFDNAGDAIDISRGGFVISNNMFTANVSTGVYFHLKTLDISTDFAVANVSVTNNTFNGTGGDVVYFDVYLDYDEFTPGLTASLGTVDVSNNTFTDCDVPVYVEHYYISEMYNGTATIGKQTYDNNTITNSSYGIYVDGLYIDDMSAGSTATLGDLAITNNRCDNCTRSAIYIGVMKLDDFYNSNGTLGSLIFTDNTVTNGGDNGIYIRYYAIENFYDGSSGTGGNATFTGNTLSGCASHGIHFYEFRADDIFSSTVTMGNVLFDDNTITDGEYGIEFENFTITEAYGSQVTMGDVTVSNSTLTEQTEESFALDYWSVWEAYGPSITRLGNLNVTNNTVTTAAGGGYGLNFNDLYYIFDIYDTSTVTVGTINITGNTVTAYSDALYLYYDHIGWDLADYSYETPVVTTGPTNITGNTFTSTDGDAAYIAYNAIGYDTYGMSKIFMGATNIANNTLAGYGNGLDVYFDYCGNEMYDQSELVWKPVTIKNNTITSSNSDAFYIEYASLDVGSENEDKSRAQLPDWVITGNKFDTADGDTGLYYDNYENPYDLYDHAHVDFGSMFIDSNTFNMDKNSGMSRGIYLYADEICYGCDDYSTTLFGDVTISNNKFYTMADEAIYCDYDGFPYELSDGSTFTAGDYSITGNMIDGADKGIYVSFVDVETYDFTKATLGDLTIAENSLTNVMNTGVDVNWDAVNSGPSTAMLTIGKTLILDNFATASTTTDTAGVWINADIGPDVTFAAPEVNGNTVSGFGVGLGFDDLLEASMRCNTVENSGAFGLFFLSSGNFTAIYNSLVDNGLGLKISTSDSATVMAEKNWWGDAAGPVACTSCNKIDAGTGTVDFDPWLRSGSISECNGFSWPMFVPAITGAGIR